MEKQNEMTEIKKVVAKRIGEGGKWEDRERAFYGKTEQDAEQAYLLWQQECYGFDTEDTLGDLTEKYIYEMLIPDRNMRYNTKRGYIMAYTKYFKGTPIMMRPLSTVRAIDLQLAYNSMDCKGVNIRLMNTLLGKLYAFLQLGSNVPDITKQVKVPQLVMKADSEIVVWTDDELKLIESRLDEVPVIRFLTVLLINTGCRIAELLGLQYSDIDVENKRIKITKQLQNKSDMTGEKKGRWFELAPPKSNDSVRVIPVSDHVIKELAIHKEWHDRQKLIYNYESDFIFTTNRGNPVNQRTQMVTFKRYYKKIGVPYKPYHTYRHTFGTNLCKRDVPIQVASKLLGHSSINVTAKYYVNIDEQQKIDAINKLFGPE
jgi:Site-specific recombinase XerD